MRTKGDSMLRLGLLAIGVLLCAVPAHALDITIPDAALETALRATAEIPDDGPITDTDLATLTELIAWTGVTSLGGLQYCVNLEYLDIDGQNVTDLSPISGLVSLRKLVLTGNPNLRTLDGIEALTSLSELRLAGLQLTDISAISGLISLDILNMNETEVPDIGPLSGLLSLNNLSASDSNISDITPLSACVDLEILNISNTIVSNIEALSSLPMLIEVYLNQTLVSDLTPLAENISFGNGDYLDIAGLLLNQTSICDAIPTILFRSGEVVNHDSGILYCDPVLPTIQLNGASTITLECPGVYTELGATATDDYENQDVSGTLVISSLTNPLVPGQYTVTYTAEDAVGNIATATRTITVVDTTAPTILREGSPVVSVNFGETYTDAGATASDSCDGDLTAFIGQDNPVNTNQVGTYTVTYSVSDAAGNAAAQVTRTVNVIDTVRPQITLTGNASPTIACGSGPYTDPGANITDIGDPGIPATIQGVGTVDTTTPGIYTLTYNIADDSGNQADQVTRTITVADTTAPVIQLNGGTVNLECGDAFTDPLVASATDTCDGDLTSLVVVTGEVITYLPGTYQRTYTVIDASNNTATAQRDVVVADTCTAVDPSRYSTDYNPQDGVISLSELLRVIQFYNSLGFRYCPEENTEDGFCPGP